MYVMPKGRPNGHPNGTKILKKTMHFIGTVAARRGEPLYIYIYILIKKTYIYIYIYIYLYWQGPESAQNITQNDKENHTGVEKQKNSQKGKSGKPFSRTHGRGKAENH